MEDETPEETRAYIITARLGARTVTPEEAADALLDAYRDAIVERERTRGDDTVRQGENVHHRAYAREDRARAALRDLLIATARRSPA